eukprot:scaffold7662_cov255-Prasinococcus_capsulatus_cf.AAC.2
MAQPGPGRRRPPPPSLDHTETARTLPRLAIDVRGATCSAVPLAHLPHRNRPTPPRARTASARAGCNVGGRRKERKRWLGGGRLGTALGELASLARDRLRFRYSAPAAGAEFVESATGFPTPTSPPPPGPPGAGWRTACMSSDSHPLQLGRVSWKEALWQCPRQASTGPDCVWSSRTERWSMGSAWLVVADTERHLRFEWALSPCSRHTYICLVVVGPCPAVRRPRRACFRVLAPSDRWDQPGSLATQRRPAGSEAFGGGCDCLRSAGTAS